MKKRMLALLLTVAMTVSAVTGCGKTGGSADNGSKKDNVSTTDSASKGKGSPDHIIVTYLTLANVPKDLKEVQDAVNKISVPKINVEVEFKPVTLSESFKNYSTWIASGEQMDLMMLCFQNPSGYISSGSLMKLDDYINADAPDIAKYAEKYPLYEGGKKDGTIYAINPVSATYGKYASVMLRKDYFDELGVKLKDKYSYDDLTQIFAGIKAKHSDTYPVGILGSDSTTSNSQFNRFNEVDTLGAGVDTGVLLGTDSKKIVDLFETDEYYAFLKQMKKWYDAGYIMKDAATTTSTMQELTSAGTTPTSLVSPCEPGVEVGYNSGFKAVGGGAVALHTTDAYTSSQGASNGTYWTIPVTSKNPDAAMKFLNLTYADTDLTNLIQWGIEGKHYVKTDVKNVIDFPKGLDANSDPYFCTLGVWGDKSAIYSMTKDNSAENKALTEKGFANRTLASKSGYSYNSSKMANQVIAVDSVLQQYMPALETGSVSDLDKTYKEFIAALKTAGIDAIIADNQAQFDAVQK